MKLNPNPPTVVTGDCSAWLAYQQMWSNHPHDSRHSFWASHQRGRMMALPARIFSVKPSFAYLLEDQLRRLSRQGLRSFWTDEAARGKFDPERMLP